MCEEEHGSKASAGGGITAQKIIGYFCQYFHIWVSILNCAHSSIFKILLVLLFSSDFTELKWTFNAWVYLLMRVCIPVQRFLLLVEFNVCSPILSQSGISNNVTVIILPFPFTNFTSQKWVNFFTSDCDIICRTLGKHSCLKFSLLDRIQNSECCVDMNLMHHRRHHEHLVEE